MNRNLLLVALSLFTWGLGESFFIYFQPLYLQQWGASSVEIGGVLGGVGVVLALSQIPTGLLTDRLGPKKLMWASWIIGVVAAWMMVIAPSLPFFIVAYLLYGLTGFGIIPMNAYITNVRGNLSVGRALTFVSGMYNLGSIIGPIVGGRIADQLGLHSIYIVAACIFVISTFLILLVQTVHEIHPDDLKQASGPKKLLGNPRFWTFLALAFFTLIALYLPQPLNSNFLQNQQHLSNTTIGIIGAVGSLGNAFATLALGNIASFWGLLIGQAWVGVFAGIYLLGNSPFWFGLGFFFFGGYRLFRSMTLAYAKPMASLSETGLLYGLLETAASLAVIIAPVLAGLLYEQDPYSIYRTSFWAILLLLALNVFMIKVVFPRMHPE
ncbi:MAG: MFS transporter [Anaerolineaceae bacterium]|nr:MFS transporter [Anaerolineaceae bacterium]